MPSSWIEPLKIISIGASLLLASSCQLFWLDLYNLIGQKGTLDWFLSLFREIWTLTLLSSNLSCNWHNFLDIFFNYCLHGNGPENILFINFIQLLFVPYIYIPSVFSDTWYQGALVLELVIIKATKLRMNRITGRYILHISIAR